MARRVLDRPPSDRYVAGGEVAPRDSGGDPGSAGRGERRVRVPPLAGGALAAALTAALLFVLGGVLGITVGQVFVAGVGGALTGLLVAGSSRPRATNRRIAGGLASAAVLVAVVGGWLFALGEGGALGPLDYAWATSGLLVPVELIVAALAAVWGVRAGPIVD